MTSSLEDYLQGQTAVAQAYPTWQWQNNPLPLRQQT